MVKRLVWCWPKVAPVVSQKLQKSDERIHIYIYFIFVEIKLLTVCGFAVWKYIMTSNIVSIHPARLCSATDCMDEKFKKSVNESEYLTLRRFSSGRHLNVHVLFVLSFIDHFYLQLFKACQFALSGNRMTLNFHLKLFA